MSTVGLFAYGETGFGTLNALLEKNRVLWVVLPEDTSESVPAEKLAKKNKIQILRTGSSKKIKELIIKNKPEIVIISSFNKILPKEILKLSKFINIHHGDLPKWRGRANVNWAIILDKKSIGITFHEAIPDLDAGNIYFKKKVAIEDKDTVATVYKKMNEVISSNINSVLKKVLNGYGGIPQRGKPTYCCTRLPEDGLIDWNKKSRDIYNLVRALTTPYPGAFTFLDSKKMLVWTAEIPENPRIYEGRIPGRIIAINDKGVEVLTGDKSIIIGEVSYNGTKGNANEFIKSVKKSLGLNILDLYEKLSV